MPASSFEEEADSEVGAAGSEGGEKADSLLVEGGVGELLARVGILLSPLMRYQPYLHRAALDCL